MMVKKAPVCAFTLIELLIVVAIIAILAAIAVPNFLEAQSRAKVSRCKNDMRTCVTALETYRLDQNAYPTPTGYSAQGNGQFVTVEPCDEVFEGFLGHRLTTPIAYVTALPVDCFKVGNGDEHPTDVPFHYSEQQNNVKINAGNEVFLRDLFRLLTGRTAAVEYYLFSHGPCLKHLDGSDAANTPCLYDPTNGTTSLGNVYVFGPGVSGL